VTTFKILQQLIVAWGIRAFGIEEMRSPYRRALRLVEEAIELGQAADVPVEMAHQIVEMVYGRPVGRTHEEVADVFNTLMAYCAARGLDLEQQVVARFSDLLGEPVEKFRKRVAEKHAAGLF
jgi:NTP pyrophosphatase (non-canonical NTP hydrolase)